MIGLLILFFFIIFWEAPALFRKRMWKELVVFGVFFSAGVVYSIGAFYNLNLLTPHDLINYVFNPVYRFMMQI